MEIALAPINAPPNRILHQYHKQLAASRATAFHRYNMQQLGHINNAEEVEERRKLIIMRVARDQWTNFVARGEDTAMLRHLHTALCEEYKEDFRFTYEVGGFELHIARRIGDEYIPVSSMERTSITNRAWQIALDLVTSRTLAA